MRHRTVLVAFLLLLLGSAFAPTHAANVYLSNSATNGYALGSDANAPCNSPSTPCLTLAGAQTAATALDTIICNDGVYSMANGITLTKALTINSRAPGLCRFTTSAAPQNVIQFSANLTLGAVTVDGVNSTAANLKPSASGLTLILNGTRVINCPTRCLDNTLGRITTGVSNSAIWASTGIGASSILTSTTSGAATFSISGGTFTADSLTNLAAALNFNPSVTGASVSVRGADIKVVAASGAGNVKCYYAPGVVTQEIVNNKCRVEGGASFTNPEGFIVPGHATVAVTKVLVDGNELSSNVAPASLTDGHGIQVGDETDLTSAAISGVDIVRNRVDGYSHAVYCGYATSACRLRRNRISNAVIGAIQEGGTAGVIETNSVVGGPLDGACLRSRHGTNNLFAGNLCVTNAVQYPSVKWIEVDDADSGARFIGNGFVNLDGELPIRAVQFDPGLTATVRANGFYSGSYAPGAFDIDIFGSAVTTPPQLDASRGYKLLRSSPWRGAGACYLSTGCAYPGIEGERGRVPPNIGPDQS